jgi:hypothetical protein
MRLFLLLCRHLYAKAVNMMGKNKILVLLCALFLTASLLYGRMETSAQPGSAIDPLVTKAYVDTQIELIRALLANNSSGGMTEAEKNGFFAEIIAYVDAAGVCDCDRATPTAVAQTPYDALFIQAGRVLIAESGTEIILRSGSASAVSGINGLCDVTAGSDIVNGMNIPVNHLLVVPASDGRGLRFNADSYVMVKGLYYFAN